MKKRKHKKPKPPRKKWFRHKHHWVSDTSFATARGGWTDVDTVWRCTKPGCPRPLVYQKKKPWW